MPFAPPHPCNQPGCAALTNDRFCPPHKRARQAKYDRERGSAAARLYGARWRKASKAFLAGKLCKVCEERGIIKLATATDHIIPHRGSRKLFWDRTNWQPLCKTCHDRKTATEDGGFGRARG